MNFLEARQWMKSNPMKIVKGPMHEYRYNGEKVEYHNNLGSWNTNPTFHEIEVDANWEIVEEKKDEKKEDYKTLTYGELIRILNKELNLKITDIKVRGDWIEKPEEETFKLCYEVKKK